MYFDWEGKEREEGESEGERERGRERARRERKEINEFFVICFFSRKKCSPYFFPPHLAKGPRVHELDRLEVRLPGVEDLLDLNRPLQVVLELFLELSSFFFEGGGELKEEEAEVSA